MIQKAPADPKTQDLRDELSIIESAPRSYPDELVTKTQTLRIAGRKLTLHLERNAVTAGDIWVFDPVTGVLAAGDLVTLPVPLLDTACPERWKIALDNISSTRFKLLVPGHGPPMQRADFETYRSAYQNLLACAAGNRPKKECGDGCVLDAGGLIGAAVRDLARTLMGYYMDSSLRGDPAKAQKLCAA